MSKAQKPMPGKFVLQTCLDAKSAGKEGEFRLGLCLKVFPASFEEEKARFLVYWFVGRNWHAGFTDNRRSYPGDGVTFPTNKTLKVWLSTLGFIQ